MSQEIMFDFFADVRIEKNGVVSARFPVLTVFCDQIIGMTIGNTNSSNG